MERVGFGRRLGSAIIDMVIVGILGSVVGFVFGGALGLLAGSASGDAAVGVGAGILGGMIGFVVIALLYGLLEAFLGRAFGGMILGIIVRNQDGSKAALGPLFFRYLVKNAGTVLTFLGYVVGLSVADTLGTIASLIILVGCFLCLRADRLTLHDMIAKTAVYSTKTA